MSASLFLLLFSLQKGVEHISIEADLHNKVLEQSQPKSQERPQ
jgi:hypothetical protein